MLLPKSSEGEGGFGSISKTFYEPIMQTRPPLLQEQRRFRFYAAPRVTRLPSASSPLRL